MVQFQGLIVMVERPAVVALLGGHFGCVPARLGGFPASVGFGAAGLRFGRSRCLPFLCLDGA